MPNARLRPKGSNPLEQTFITDVEIEQLFGLYSYHLGGSPTTQGDERRLFLLYGDNGSGKTTVLHLLFNLLSQARNQGHRSYIARTPFRRLSVTLGGGIVITASRSGELVGTYELAVTRKKTTLLRTVIEATDAAKVAGDQPGLDAYIKILSELDIDLYYLTDDRKGRRSAPSEEEADHERLLLRMYQDEFRRHSNKRVEVRDWSEARLEVTISRFDSYIRNQVLAGSTTGEVNTNTVYADIIKRIAKPRKGRPTGGERDLDTLVAAMEELEKDNQRYVQFGLTSRLSAAPIIGASSSATPATKRIIASVLGPYVDGIRARLEALESVQRLIQAFVESLNSFLHNKAATFDPRSGLQIRSRNGELLAPSMLSSGERQLLLLLCNTVLARDEATIFMIDEPEISLNIKWQRTLVDALLRLTVDAPVQFVVATHSLEILARHRSAVRQLVDHTR